MMDDRINRMKEHVVVNVCKKKKKKRFEKGNSILKGSSDCKTRGTFVETRWRLPDADNLIHGACALFRLLL